MDLWICPPPPKKFVPPPRKSFPVANFEDDLKKSQKDCDLRLKKQQKRSSVNFGDELQKIPKRL